MLWLIHIIDRKNNLGVYQLPLSNNYTMLDTPLCSQQLNLLLSKIAVQDSTANHRAWNRNLGQFLSLWKKSKASDWLRDPNLGQHSNLGHSVNFRLSFFCENWRFGPFKKFYNFFKYIYLKVFFLLYKMVYFRNILKFKQKKL